MKLISDWIEILEDDVNGQLYGHVDLAKFTDEEREKAFIKFGEGNEDLARLLKVAYEHNAESIFCCSGHGGPDGYVLFKVNEENLQYLQDVGKVLSNFGVITNFENHYKGGKRVDYRGVQSSDWFGIAAEVMQNLKDFDSENPSKYYHEEMHDARIPLKYRIKKNLLALLKKVENKNKALPEPKDDNNSTNRRKFIESLSPAKQEREELGEVHKNEINNQVENEGR